MITVGNLPAWIPQIARACPFLFPMETRNSIFFITTFDRERALKQLAVLKPEFVANRSDALITARLQAKQIVVDLRAILDETKFIFDKIIPKFNNTLLEIKFKNEVGFIHKD